MCYRGKALRWLVGFGLSLGAMTCAPNVALREAHPKNGAAAVATTAPPPSSVVAKVAPLEAVPSPPPIAGEKPTGRIELVLPSGARLVIEPDPLASAVAVTALFSVGAADETDAQAGIRHLLERLLLDPDAAAGVRASLLRARGGEVVSFTAPDYTLYQVVTARSALFQSLDFLAALFDDTLLREPAAERLTAALERQQRVVQSELLTAQRDGEGLRRLIAATYAGHPYQRPLLGTADGIGRLHGADLRDFFRRHYQPRRLTLVLTGALDAKAAAEQVRALFPASSTENSAPAGAWALPTVKAVSALLPGPHVVVSTAEGDSGTAAGEALLGFAVPAAPTLDLAALDLAAMILRQSDDRRAARSLLLFGQHPGLFVLRAPLAANPGSGHGSTADAPDLDDTVHMLLDETRRLLHGSSPSDFLRAQRRLLFDLAERDETPAARGRRLATFALLDLSEEAYATRLGKMTPALLRAALEPLLRPENLTLGITNPARRRSRARTEPSESRLRTLVEESFHKRSPAPATATAAPLPPSVPSSPEQPLLYRLRSGARLVILRDGRVHEVALAAVWPGGLLREDEKSAGLHQVLGQSWLRATRGRSAERLSSELDELATTLSAEVGENRFGLRAQFLSEQLAPSLALIRDCIDEPIFLDADIERGQKEQLAAAKQTGALSEAWRLFRQGLRVEPTAPAAPPLPALGTLNRRRLGDTYRRLYGPNGEGRGKLVLAVVGDVAPAALLAELEPWLGVATPLSFSELRVAVPAAMPPMAPPVLAQQRFAFSSEKLAHLVLGFSAAGASATDRASLEVLLELLREPLDRALMRRGLVSSFDGQLGPASLDRASYLAFAMTADPLHLETAEVALRDELHQLVDHPATAEGILAARERLQNRRALAEPRRIDRALKLAEALLFGPLEGALETSAAAVERRLSLVDAAAVQAAARRVLREEHMVRISVLPEARPAPLAESSAKPIKLAKVFTSSGGHVKRLVREKSQAFQRLHKVRRP